MPATSDEVKAVVPPAGELGPQPPDQVDAVESSDMVQKAIVRGWDLTDKKEIVGKASGDDTTVSASDASAAKPAVTDASAPK